MLLLCVRPPPLGWRTIPEEHPGFSTVSAEQTAATSGAATLRVFLPQWERVFWGAGHAPACGTAGNHRDLNPQPLTLQPLSTLLLKMIPPALLCSFSTHRQHFESVDCRVVSATKYKCSTFIFPLLAGFSGFVAYWADWDFEGLRVRKHQRAHRGFRSACLMTFAPDSWSLQPQWQTWLISSSNKRKKK